MAGAGTRAPEPLARPIRTSVGALRDLYRALKARDGDLAEKIARSEAMNASAEIMRIFGEPLPKTL